MNNSLSNTAYLKTVGTNKSAIIPFKKYYLSIYGNSHSAKSPETAYR